MVDSAEKTKVGDPTPSPQGAENVTQLERLYETSKKTRLMDMLEQIIAMTQYMLNAEASSILLFRDNDHELYDNAYGMIKQLVSIVLSATTR